MSGVMEIRIVCPRYWSSIGDQLSWGQHEFNLLAIIFLKESTAFLAKYQLLLFLFCTLLVDRGSIIIRAFVSVYGRVPGLL